MNKIDKKPNYKKLYSIILEVYNKSGYFNHGCFDETYFSLRVYESAKEISKHFKNVKLQQLLVASILHDIGKIRLDQTRLVDSNGYRASFPDEWSKHGKYGVPLVKKILKKEGYSNDFIIEVCYLIENHNVSFNKLVKPPLELKILKDADLIADIGLSGFIRPFLHAGKFRRSVISTVHFIQDHDRTESGKGLILSISKRIAKREMNIQNKFAKSMYKLIDSDLLK